MTSSWCHTVFCASVWTEAVLQVCRLQAAASVQVERDGLVGIKRVTWRFWFWFWPGAAHSSPLWVWVESNITIQLQINVLTNLHFKHFPVKWNKKHLGWGSTETSTDRSSAAGLSDSVSDCGWNHQPDAWRRPMKRGLSCCCDVMEAHFSFGEGRSYISAAVRFDAGASDTEEATWSEASRFASAGLRFNHRHQLVPHACLPERFFALSAVPQICLPPPDVLSSPEVGPGTRRVTVAKTNGSEPRQQESEALETLLFQTCEHWADPVITFQPCEEKIINPNQLNSHFE